MSWYMNLKISSKLILAFCVVIALTIFLAVFSIIQMKDVDESYTLVIDYTVKRMQYMLEAEAELINIRRYVLTACLYAGEDQRVKSAQTNAYDSYNKATYYLDEYEVALIKDPTTDNATMNTYQRKVKEIRDNLTNYFSMVDGVFAEALAGNQNGAKENLDVAAGFMTAAIDMANEIFTVAEQTMNTTNVQVTNRTDGVTRMLAVVSVAVVVIALVLAIIISNVIKKPIIELAVMAREVASGNMNVNIETLTKGYCPAEHHKKGNNEQKKSDKDIWVKQAKKYSAI